MEIRTLITFLRVAELRSFSRAAAQLGYSQAAVTIQIGSWRRSWASSSLSASARRCG